MGRFLSPDSVMSGVNGEKVNNIEFAATVLCGISSKEGINGSKLRGIHKRSKEVLRTAISQTKKDLYNLKIRDIKIEVAKRIGSEIFDGAKSIGLEWVDSKYDITPLW